MIGFRIRALTTAAAAATLLGALTLVAPGGAAHPRCVLADARAHAAVVVHHSDNRPDRNACVTFAGSGMGAEQALTQSGIEYQVAFYAAVQGDAVCQVDYEPSGSGPWTSDNCLGGRYWGVYVSRRGGAWYSSPVGVSDIQLADGDALGLTFGSKPPVPPWPQGVCPPPQPRVTPSAPGVPAPPGGASGPPPGSDAGSTAPGGGGAAGTGASTGAVVLGAAPASGNMPAGSNGLQDSHLASQPPGGIAPAPPPAITGAAKLAYLIRGVLDLDGRLAAVIAGLAMMALAAYRLAVNRIEP